MKLNLGCGFAKIEGFVNVDIDKEAKPDIVADITIPLPFESNSVDEIVMFHTIEHIRKLHHFNIFVECQRLLKIGGSFYLTYPEFETVFENWKNDLYGDREFWESTIYGRQSSPFDYHVCIMHTPEVKNKLISAGFEIVEVRPEFTTSPYNTFVHARKFKRFTYEEALANLIGGKDAGCN